MGVGADEAGMGEDRGEIDLGGMFSALGRRKKLILGSTRVK
jgi:hypothetical protein